MPLNWLSDVCPWGASPTKTRGLSCSWIQRFQAFGFGINEFCLVCFAFSRQVYKLRVRCLLCIPPFITVCFPFSCVLLFCFSFLLNSSAVYSFSYFGIWTSLIRLNLRARLWVVIWIVLGSVTKTDMKFLVLIRASSSRPSAGLSPREDCCWSFWSWEELVH